MKKIRIGNDIRLAVDLRQYLRPRKYLREREVYNPDDENYNDIDNNPFVNKSHEVYWPNQYPVHHNDGDISASDGMPISIRSVKAILINTTRQKDYAEALKRNTRFIKRFPIEPELEAFHSTPYDICNSGYSTWRAYPNRPWGRPWGHMWGHHGHPYHGFGLKPHWEGLGKPLCMHKDFEYNATVCATEKQNVVEVSFPAEDQLFTGTYSLIVVAKVFAPGFNSKNLKTITIDLPDVFELVKMSADAIDSDVLGYAAEIKDKLPCYEVYIDPDIYVKEGQVQTEEVEGDHILLDRTDGNTVDIDLSSVVSWLDRDMPQGELDEGE